MGDVGGPALAISWGSATRICPGETSNGDLAVVEPFAGGALIAAVDGAGHGGEAARAAATARAELGRRAGATLPSIVAGCHEALRRTRGAALGLASVSATAGTLSWVGVGNVAGLLVCRRSAGRQHLRWMRMPGGMAGHALPATAPARFALGHGDVLILVTDGVLPGFADELELTGRTPDIAERLLVRHWSGRDDGLAVVVRFLRAAG